MYLYSFNISYKHVTFYLMLINEIIQKIKGGKDNIKLNILILTVIHCFTLYFGVIAYNLNSENNL